MHAKFAPPNFCFSPNFLWLHEQEIKIYSTSSPGVYSAEQRLYRALPTQKPLTRL